MLPAGAVTVIDGLRLHVLEAFFFFQRRDFEFTVVQMFEAFTQELAIYRSKNIYVHIYL